MELELIKTQKKKLLSKIPSSISTNKFLQEIITQLPENYNFEIYKSIWRIEKLKKELKKDLRIILQLPQGLQMFACYLTDIFENFTNSEVLIIADENYGACCIEDIGGYLLDADFIIHYGHSCLVPIPDTLLKTMYVFVDIMFDVEHLFKTILFNFKDKTERFYLMSVIQFNGALYMLRDFMVKEGYTGCVIPQERPRCGGEVF